MGPTETLVWSGTALNELLQRIEGLRNRGGRVLVGIVGPPGAGKSTLAAALLAAVERRWPGEAALVPMDGFHQAQSLIESEGLDEVKGAPETFDAGGYVSLLRRIRRADELVLAPEFRREIDDPVAGAIPVAVEARIVITEGNYLLLDQQPWANIALLLDEVWFVALPDEIRVERLVERHMRFKEDGENARRRALGSDQRNAELVLATLPRADLIIQYH